ncbi:uncharacterized protein LOC112468471 [Temnothorax curvispinosus]|uniref:Uncharacterized protein LOC112466345 n=1 Tax=Temnothorax curvispinosus TaxID=300111 RepID=A0A6J1RL21_9HYME|nr:uncharacterized protein LOC112466345 [Temnothorax curvispinosus]XP_024893435.1 uncharacterized protein LOC112468471 [Temnothorax curvispinosus]
MSEEFEALERNETWELVSRPPGRNIITCKWAYKKRIWKLSSLTSRQRSQLNEEVFMEVPKGLNVNSTKLTFTDCLKKFNLVPSQADPCVFYGTVDGHELYVLLYVDDGLVLSRSTELIHQLLSHMKRNFELTIGNCQYYVGMEIRSDRAKKGMCIGQQAYIKKLISKYHLVDAVTASTLADAYVKLTKGQDESKWELPAVSLRIQGPSRYTDADFAGAEAHQSTTGFVFTLGGGPVTWRNQRKKKVVTLSICQLLKDVNKELVGPTPLRIDNQSTLRLIRNSEVHARTKHFDVQLHFVRETNKSGTIAVEYVPSDKQLADVFTKPLTRDNFVKNIKGLNIVNIYDEWEC